MSNDNDNNSDNRYGARRFASVIAAAASALVMMGADVSAAHDAEAHSGPSFDGLKRVEDSAVARAYIDPNADFSVYKRVRILAPYVAFRRNWRRDQNRGSSLNVSSREMERIKSRVGSLFESVFTEVLEAGDRFEVVEENGDDVLLLRPAIIDLDIAAPDTMSAGRSRTFTTSTGAATLYIELYDSVSGAILGRATDRQSIRSASAGLAWSSRGTNSAAGRRLLRSWAELLRNFLDQHFTK